MYSLEPAVIRSISFLVMLLAMFGLECVTPFRVPVESKFRRWVKNLSLAAGNTAILSVSVSAYLLWLVQYVNINKIGLFSDFGVGGLWNVLFTFVLFDFMTYIWHMLNHLVPFLWRFHKMHHTDLDLDVSTASRFHIGELLLSAGFKGMLVYLFGPNPIAFVIFESAVVTAAQFHHSNIRIPPKVEGWVWYFLVVPSMHRIHHSIIGSELNSNFATIFSFWDRIAKTFRDDVMQGKIIIGLKQYRDSNELTLTNLLIMPFKKPVERP